ncbi:hypothetical protein BGX20_004642 [Mortierella sp. AD010]|nr:hypothetical protein BGX20_004642 [Mortierella sp. AD010]
MYVLGGIPLLSTTRAVTSQTFMIDLSASWNTSEPIYKKLPNGPIGSPGSAVAALSPNNQLLFTLVNNTIYTYDLESRAWNNVITNTNFSSFAGISAVTDPNTGIIYIPNGYTNPTLTSMLAIDSESETTNTIAMDPMLAQSSYYSAAWNTELGSMILTGGTINGLYAYNPISNGWSNLTSLAKGDIPSSRLSSCLLPAFEGSKMILFGGVNVGGSDTFYDIYILDVHTLTWKRGPDVTPTNGRAMAACSVSNGNFIVWGGGTVVSGTSSVPDDTVMVFDLLAGAWVSKYNVDLLSPPANTTSTSDGSKSHRVAIASALSAVFVVALIVLLVVIHRYRSRRSQTSNNGNNDGSDKSKNSASSAVELTSVSSIPQKQSFYEFDPAPIPTPPAPAPTSLPAPVYNHHNRDIQPVARWAKTYSQELTDLSRKDSLSTLQGGRHVHRQSSHQSMIGSSVGDQGSVRAPSSMSGVSGGKCSIFEDLKDDDCGVDNLEEYEYKLPSTY